MNCALAVFDVAGTTVKDADFVASSFQEALQSKGVHAELTEFQGFLGYPKSQALDLFLEHRGLPHLREDQAGIFAEFESRMEEFYRNDARVEPVPGAEEAIARLREAGVKVALVSGFRRHILDAILGRLGWESQIDMSVAADEVAFTAPAPDMIQRAMSHLGVGSGSLAAKIGDTPIDMQQGTAAGCRWVIGVTSGCFSREQLEQTPHTHIVEGPLEAAQVILAETPATVQPQLH